MWSHADGEIKEKVGCGERWKELERTFLLRIDSSVCTLGYLYLPEFRKGGTSDRSLITEEEGKIDEWKIEKGHLE